MAEEEKTKRAGRAESPKPGASSTKIIDDERSKNIDQLKQQRLIIPEEGLKRIADHKYVAGVYTPMDNFMSAYVWSPMLVGIPRWMAPNAITVTGLAVQIVGYAVLAYYCPDFRAAAPRWAYALASFTIFCYQTLDALDGKQARRTGSSSPLGQLFDHGCDSIVTIFMSMITAMCLHLGFCVRCVSFVMCMLLPFWIAQWTEYHAHVLPTSIGGIVGVTEFQLFSMLLTLSNCFAPGFFEQEVGIGAMPSWWCGRESCPIQWCDGVVFMQSCTAVAGTLHCFHQVLPVTSKKGTTGVAFMQFIPAAMLTIVGWLWCIMIPQSHPRLVLFTLGVSFSHMTCKMIIAAMSRTEYHIFQPVIIHLPVIFIIAKMGLLPRHTDVILGAYTAISIYSMSKWVKSVIEEISQYIGIHTFRLGPRAKPKDT